MCLQWTSAGHSIKSVSRASLFTTSTLHFAYSQPSRVVSSVDDPTATTNYEPKKASSLKHRICPPYTKLPHQKEPIVFLQEHTATTFCIHALSRASPHIMEIPRPRDSPLNITLPSLRSLNLLSSSCPTSITQQAHCEVELQEPRPRRRSLEVSRRLFDLTDNDTATFEYRTISKAFSEEDELPALSPYSGPSLTDEMKMTPPDYYLRRHINGARASALAKRCFVNCYIENCRLLEAGLTRDCRLSVCDFEIPSTNQRRPARRQIGWVIGSHISNTKMKFAHLQLCHAETVQLQDCEVVGSTIKEESVLMEDCTIRLSKIDSSLVKYCGASQTVFTDATITGCTIKESTLTNCKVEDCRLYDCTIDLTSRLSKCYTDVNCRLPVQSTIPETQQPQHTSPQERAV